MQVTKSQQPRCPKPVLIVGAGLAGLSAAIALVKEGIPIIITEAQGRCGGRVRSVKLPESKQSVECGATFFHGTKGNAAWDLALKYNLVTPQQDSNPRDDYEDDDGLVDLFSSDSAYISNKRETSMIPYKRIISIAKLYNVGLKRAESMVFGAERSVNSVVSEVIDCAKHDDDPRFISSVVHSCECFERAVNGCGSTDCLSANLCNQYVTLPGDNVRATHPPGMSGIVEGLVSELRQHNTEVSLNTQVVYIKDWLCKANEKSKDVIVRIKKRYHIDYCRKDADDDEHEEEICVAGVIWTPSVGVTLDAHKSGTVFSPALPPMFIEALSRRGFGAVEQIHACISSATAAEDSTDNSMIPLVWEEPKNSHWRYGIFGLLRRGSSVSFWLCGLHARLFREASDEERRSDVRQLIRQVIPGYEEGEVSCITFSNWSGNEMIRGGYSYPLVGGREDDMEQLAKELGSEEEMSRLWIAGEATHPQFYSTMHGAIESGRREARRCIEAWNRVHVPS